jgi:c-di-GMP-related signal transduction protein
MAAIKRVFVKSSPNSFPHSAMLLGNFWHQNLVFEIIQFCRTVARLQSQGVSKVAKLRTTGYKIQTNYFILSQTPYKKLHPYSFILGMLYSVTPG